MNLIHTGEYVQEKEKEMSNKIKIANDTDIHLILTNKNYDLDTIVKPGHWIEIPVVDFSTILIAFAQIHEAEKKPDIKLEVDNWNYENR